LIADIMRNPPGQHFSFPEWEGYRNAKKDKTARLPNPKHGERRQRIEERPCNPFGERGILLDNLPHTSNVQAIINNHGWNHFIREPPMYDEELVKEFYANMNPPVYHERYTVMVRGVAVRISIDDICRYHRVPRHADLGPTFGMSPHDAFTVNLNPVIASSLRRTGMPQWVRTQMELLKSELHIDLAFLMLFIKSSLKPSTHNTTADPQVAQVLFSLHNGLPMDVGHIIWMEILDAGMALDEVLPFPCMITHFCQQAGIGTGQLTRSRKMFDNAHYSIQIRAAQDLDRKRERERIDREREAHVQQLAEDPEYSEGEYEDDPDFDVHDEQGPEEYQHTGDTPPWARHMMQQMQQINQGVSALNTRFYDMEARLDDAGIPRRQGDEASRRRVRRRDGAGPSTSRG
jgi:hypothetical protein